MLCWSSSPVLRQTPSRRRCHRDCLNKNSNATIASRNPAKNPSPPHLCLMCLQCSQPRQKNDPVFVRPPKRPANFQMVPLKRKRIRRDKMPATPSSSSPPTLKRFDMIANSEIANISRRKKVRQAEAPRCCFENGVSRLISESSYVIWTQQTVLNQS